MSILEIRFYQCAVRHVGLCLAGVRRPPEDDAELPRQLPFVIPRRRLHGAVRGGLDAALHVGWRGHFQFGRDVRLLRRGADCPCLGFHELAANPAGELHVLCV